MTTLRCLLIPLALLVPMGSFAASPGAQETLEELERKLEDEDERKRRTAVKALAELGTTEAWELVLGRLVDEKPEVADQAQIEIARLDSEDEWELLEGKAGLKSKRPDVRVRVAEALGRSETAPPVELLEKAVKDSEAEVRRLAWWSVERLALAGRVGEEEREDLVAAALKAARRDRDDEVRGAALIAATVLDPAETADGREDAARSKHPVVVRVASVLAHGVAGSLSEGLRASAIAAISEAALDEDAERGLRSAAVEALARIGTREALAALVDVLEGEDHPRLQAAAIAELRSATGAGLGNNPRGWRAWIAKLKDDWEPVRGGSELETDGSMAELGGLPLLSDRVAVLIDMSGSMWQTRDDGRKFKDLVDDGLRRFLGELDVDVEFDLIPYANEPISFAGGLIPATRMQVELAATWFAECELRGSGAVWEAVELALEDPAVDTLIVLTDGKPSGGIHWNLDLMVPLLLERVRLRRIAFDAIVTEPEGWVMKHWGTLAAGSDGIAIPSRFRGQ